MADAAGRVYPVHNNVFKFGIKGSKAQRRIWLYR